MSAPASAPPLLALVCNQKPLAVAGQVGPDDQWEEFDRPETIAALRNALQACGYAVTVLEADKTLPVELSHLAPQLVFNIAEGHSGRCREALVPGLCELLGIAYTGSDALTLAAALDKTVAKRLVAHEVRAPLGWLIEGEADIAALQRVQLPFPLITKPNAEGSSKGIDDSSRCSDLDQLLRDVRRLLAAYGPVLVEQFIAGTEVSVGLVGNGEPQITGMMQMLPAEGPNPDFIYSLQVKRDWRERVRYAVPPELPDGVCERAAQAARAVFRLLGCRDVARVDLRIDADGQPWFIEANPLPGLDPVTSDLVILSVGGGWTHASLIARIVREAENRAGLPHPVPA